MVTGSMCAPASILGRQKNRDRRMDRWFNGRANTAFHGFDASDWTLAWVHYRSILLSPFSCQHRPRALQRMASKGDGTWRVTIEANLQSTAQEFAQSQQCFELTTSFGWRSQWLRFSSPSSRPSVFVDSIRQILLRPCDQTTAVALRKSL